ncbi:hypothetical protein ACPXCO_06710 [Streptomyces cyaneofuscatus]|uniref:hypothetical protein n=1 Tax=Streptomyces cyaneofuscatus TaxID=66883 RepID=UPI003CF36338
MSMILLIRSVDHTEAAIRQASDYLAHHRRQFTDPHHRDTLLGIWIRSELDADLPASIPCGPSAKICGCTVDEPSRRHPTEAPLGIRTSSSLSGLWSLCWLDGPVLRQAHSPQQRRHRILDTLVNDAAPQARPGAFFPVFDPADSSDIVDQRLAELRSRHPHLIATHWFVDDPERGITGPRGTAEAPCRLERGTAGPRS